MFKTDVTIRKIRKPMMEKKRRARINDSLETLKDILLKNTVAIAQGTRPTKLEKADILEMTVRYLHVLQHRLNAQNRSKNADDVSSTTSNHNDIANIGLLPFYQCSSEQERMPAPGSHGSSASIPKMKHSKQHGNGSGFDPNNKENIGPKPPFGGSNHKSMASSNDCGRPSVIPSHRSAFSAIDRRNQGVSSNREANVLGNSDDHMWRPW